MTQSEFLEKKQKKKKKFEKLFLEQFNFELAKYFRTACPRIYVDTSYHFSKKEALAIIASEHPDLKLRLHFYRQVDNMYTRHSLQYMFTPKRKFTIFGREVWI